MIIEENVDDRKSSRLYHSVYHISEKYHYISRRETKEKLEGNII